MHIRKPVEQANGWRRFDLNVGGFSIRHCWWYPPSGQILFPRRYSRRRRPIQVVRVSGRLVNRLRDLLESGEMAMPRDRRPCTLKVRILGAVRAEPGWWVFSFSVRGFTILGCRWHPSSGSIQLPVTFGVDQRGQETRRMIVRAYGAHINRLRDALEDAYDYGQDEENAEEQELEEGVPAGVDDWN
jgi:hypothetical protein